LLNSCKGFLTAAITVLGDVTNLPSADEPGDDSMRESANFEMTGSAYFESVVVLLVVKSLIS
jgi:hypothetical protein